MADETSQGTPIPVKTGSSGVNPSWTTSVTPASPPAPAPLSVAASLKADAIPPASAVVNPQHPGPPPLASPAGQEQPSLPRLPSASPGSLPTPRLLPDPLEPAGPQLAAEQTLHPIQPDQSTAPPPAVEPPIPPELSITPPPPPSRIFPWRTVGIVGGIVVVIVGTILLLWWQGIVIGAPRDPARALANMVQALAKTPAYHTEGQTVLTIGPPESQPASVESSPVPKFLAGLAASAAIALSEAQPLGTDTLGDVPFLTDRFELTFGFQGDRVDATTSQLTFSLDLSGLVSVLPPTIPPSIDLDLRRVGGDIYIRLPVLSLITGSQNNKWLAFSERDLASLNTQKLDWQSIDLKALARAVTGGERVGYERIGPAQTAHYRVDLDPLTLIEVFELRQSLSSLTEYLSSVTIQAEFWLGTRDSRPYQYQITGRYTDSTMGLDANLRVRALLSAFGQPTTIVPPDEEQVERDGFEGIFDGDFSDFEMKARDLQRKADLGELKSALELYKGDHGSYPSSNRQISRTNDPHGALLVLTTKGYLASLPLDPLDPTNWYGYQSDGMGYELWSILEDEADPLAEDRGEYAIYRLMSDRKLP